MRVVGVNSGIGIALCLASSAASAFDARLISPHYQMVFAGSASSSTSVRNWIMERICDTSQQIDVFTATGYDDWAVACVTRSYIDANADGDTQDFGEFIDSKRVLFRKRGYGGSAWGVTPVLHPMNVPLGTVAHYGVDTINPGGVSTGFAVDMMAVTSANCTGSVARTTPVGTSYIEYQCGTAKEQKVPDAGFSDVEPDKYFGINTPNAVNAAGALPEYTNSVGWTSWSWGALVFNTPVSLNLRNALQAAQGLMVGSETEANMPSLTTTEIRGLFAGGIVNWNNLLVVNPSNPGGPRISLASHPAVVALGTVPTDRKVQICRGSPGLTAQFNAIFLGVPCDSNSVTPVAEPGSTLTGPVVAGARDSVQLLDCIADFNNGTNNSSKNPGLTQRWTIGIASTELNVSLSKAMRFIKINGYAPTLQNVHAGDYEDYADHWFQYRTNVATYLNASGPDQAATRQILDYIGIWANFPTEKAMLNLSLAHTWGQGGWLVPPLSSGGYTSSNPFSVSNPVNSSTRGPFGRQPSVCQMPIPVKPVQIDSNL